MAVFDIGAKQRFAAEQTARLSDDRVTLNCKSTTILRARSLFVTSRNCDISAAMKSEKTYFRILEKNVSLDFISSLDQHKVCSRQNILCWLAECFTKTILSNKHVKCLFSCRRDAPLETFYSIFSIVTSIRFGICFVNIFLPVGKHMFYIYIRIEYRIVCVCVCVCTVYMCSVPVTLILIETQSRTNNYEYTHSVLSFQRYLFQILRKIKSAIRYMHTHNRLYFIFSFCFKYIMYVNI